jgi:circadian clock protein KaiC
VTAVPPRVKLRGSSYHQGSAFAITAAGLQVYLPIDPAHVGRPYDAVFSRVPWGVPGLDRMLDGGSLAGSATLLAGPTGSGKTTAGIQFIIEGLRRGERCLLVNFQENPTQLARQIGGISCTLDDDARGRLDLLYYSSVELPIDSIVVSIFQMLTRKVIRRVVIDALEDLAIAATDSTRLHNYLYAMVQHFAVMGVTSVLALETDPPIMASDENQGRMSHMADNIIFLGIELKERIVGRTLRIAKARGVPDLQARELPD